MPTRRSLLQSLVLGTTALATDGVFAAEKKTTRLLRTDPASLGIDPASVVTFADKVGPLGLHSFMLLRHGKVAAEGWWTPYAPEHPHMLYSLSKSFTSTAVGLAVHQKLLTVEDTVLSFFPGDAPAQVSANLAKMRVKHLLTMSTGHDQDATGRTTAARDGNWVKAFLSLPVEHEPGSKFVYNSAATYMLSAIVQKLTGATVLNYLTPRLFEPIGIEHPTWETCPRGINTGGWGLSVKTEDIARFGQLYLQRGKWHDKQLVPESWIATATSKQIDNGSNPNSDWNQGYGYQFWRCRHGAFRGDGAFGQYCLVMPEQDAVLAITSGLGDMQAVLNGVWDHLLPGIGKSPETANAAEMRRHLKKLEMAAPAGAATGSIASKVKGKAFRFEANPEKLESAALGEEGSRYTLTLHDEKGERKLVAGTYEWVNGTAPLVGRGDSPMAARCAWDGDTLNVTLCFYETPYVETQSWKFSEDQITVTRKMNVGFGPTQLPALTGRVG